MTESKPNIHDALLKMQAKYVSELPGKLDDLEDLCMGFATGESGNAKLLALAHLVHSIKGSAGTFGVSIVSTICHQFEDRINEIKENVPDDDRAFVDDALRYIDLLREAVGQVLEGKTDFPVIEEKLAELVRQMNKETAKEIRPLSLLVADTSRTTAVMLRASLQGASISVEGEDTDFGALKRLMDERFDVVVCGLGVGLIGGLGLISALKLSNGRSRDAVTVLLTSDMESFQKTDPAPDVVLNRGLSLGEDLMAVLDTYAARLSSA